ncbi:ABC transporter substrate-binding protein [Telmatospirillum siberiense]|uniref:Bicyclomycin resistance protein n=1 Tax=Telmatospirillum siberiense TaxID=382514 RepID=A0A2N3PM87_9PROT|nr:ABC transporter substrate-binding protein [Telmatospirillum siberiense]PKU21529.1 bicyclomycin resistance protein [Telmatospirillum siberiense]
MINPWTFLTRRIAPALAGMALLAAHPIQARADEAVVLGSNWFAEAEHGGFYQALATGIYKKYGLDVTIKMGGPQINGIQLLAGGLIDIWMGYDFQTLKALEQGVPAVTIAGFFQKDPQAILAHPDVKTYADLKGKPIYLASASDVTFWPWLKAKYGYTDAQKKPYAFSVAPFLADKTSAQQGYVTSEPFAMMQGGVTPTALLMADDGYPPYATTLVTLQKTIDGKSDALARFVKASAEGWKSYLADPAPGNALIKKDNPKMTDEQLAFGVEQIKKFGLVTGGDAAKSGIGAMTDARWKQTDDVMVQNNLLPAAVDYKRGYTLKFVKDLPLP